MILQSVIFADDICKKNELFFRGNCTVEGGALFITAGGRVSFDTYMNIFDLCKWESEAGIKDVSLEVECRGEGCIKLVHMENGKRRVAAAKRFDFTSDTKAVLTPALKNTKGYLQVEAEAGSSLVIKSMNFITGRTPVTDIKAAAIICTYDRFDEVNATIERLKGIKDLSLYVIDNKKELPEISEDELTIVHNENTGGAGGFTRGLQLARKDQSRKGFTHVIFMDDDAYVNAETIKRTFSFLSFLKPEYSDRPLAGRMFLNDAPHVQHTAAEIWNGGDIKHIGGSFDMTRREILPDVNDGRGGEYGGFWYLCVPYGFAKDNNPLQIFMHCDDVEYGLRMGKEPLILNGIQAWHESPLKRGTHIAAYYDLRNSMIVNSLGYDKKSINEAANFILKSWRERLAIYKGNHDCDSENMALLAMEDFLKGPDFVYKTDGGRLHQKLLSARSAEAIGKRPLRIAYKLPCEKINEFKRAAVEKKVKTGLREAVEMYRKAGTGYANENL